MTKSIKLLDNLNMDKFWRLVVRIRNSSYQRAIKGVGLEGAESEYKLNFLGATSGYVIAFFFIILFMSLNFHDGSKILDTKEYSLLMRFLLAMVVIYLPMKLINYFLLKKVEHIPIPKEFDKKDYQKHRIFYWIFLLAGQVLWISVWILGISMRN